MTRTLARYYWTAGLLFALGCRGAPSLVKSLPGGETPASFHLRPAETPARDERPIAQVGYEWNSEPSNYSPRRTPATVMPPYAPAPAAPEGRAYAADHRWLVGTLSFDEAHGQWSVCYADASLGDTYGGKLELITTATMTGFSTGELVRVEGELVDPAPLETKPAYRVRSLQLVRHRD